MELLLDRVESPIGTMVLGAAGGRLCMLDFDDGDGRATALLWARFGQLRPCETADPWGFSSRIRAYLGGDLTALDAISVDPGGTPFQRQVWEALRAIPAGTTLAYGALAARLGRPGASRAVGLANSLNPVAVVVPCHRVIGADGSLTGYAGGIGRKRWLLEHEGALAPQTCLPLGFSRERV